MIFVNMTVVPKGTLEGHRRLNFSRVLRRPEAEVVGANIWHIDSAEEDPGPT
jgi:hypothetical protein